MDILNSINWSRINRLAGRARVALRGERDDALKVARDLCWLDMDNEGEEFLRDVLLALVLEHPEIPSEIRAASSWTLLRIRLLLSEQIEQRLPLTALGSSIRAGPSEDLFLEASRLALGYLRENDTRETPNLLYASVIARVLAEPRLIQNRALMPQIRNHTLVGDSWVGPTSSSMA